MAGFADSNRASLRYLAEDPSGWGITPASGAPREMRITGSQLAAQKETVTSEELRSDRMVPNIVEVAASAEGEINFEFSAGAIDDFLAAFLYGEWSRPMTFDVFKGKHVSITDTDEITISGGEYEHYFTVGRYIKLEGWMNAGNNAYAVIATATDGVGNTVITVTGPTLTVESGNADSGFVDANDVLVRSTAIRFGTAGASTIDSNGGDAFASVIAAGQIVVGQKIHIDGLGMEAGSITIAAGVVAAGARLMISDGEKRKGFQFGGVLLPGYIDVAPGADESAAAANLAAAIMAETAKGNLKIRAIATLGVVDLTNLAPAAGGSIVEEADTGADLTVVDFTGGVDSIRGVFEVTSAADDVIGISPAPATNANAGTAMITVKGSMIRNPSNVADFVRQSFTVETSFEDVDRHFVATGLRVGQFELEVNSGEISTGMIQMMGRSMERRIDNTSLLRNSPYTPKLAPQHEIMNATSNVGDLTIDGDDGLAFIQSISISGDASLREQRAVGHKYAVGIGVGRFQLTGSFAAYFETGELFDRFVAHDTLKLAFYYKDLGNNRYDITIPAIKLTSDPVAPEGIDQDIIENIEWEAQRDPATACMIQIDRFSSLLTPMA